MAPHYHWTDAALSLDGRDIIIGMTRNPLRTVRPYYSSSSIACHPLIWLTRRIRPGPPLGRAGDPRDIAPFLPGALPPHPRPSSALQQNIRFYSCHVQVPLSHSKVVAAGTRNLREIGRERFFVEWPRRKAKPKPAITPAPLNPSPRYHKILSRKVGGPKSRAEKDRPDRRTNRQIFTQMGNFPEGWVIRTRRDFGV